MINKINGNSFLLARYSQRQSRHRTRFDVGDCFQLNTVNAKFEPKENEAQKWVANTACENCDQKEGIGEWDCWIVIRTLHLLFAQRLFYPFKCPTQQFFRALIRNKKKKKRKKRKEKKEIKLIINSFHV